MSTTTAEKLKTVDGCFGNYPQTQALKSGSITSDRIALRLTEVNPIYKSFFMMVRELKFDVCEIALVTYLQAKAFGKPLTLMPATMKPAGSLTRLVGIVVTYAQAGGSSHGPRGTGSNRSPRVSTSAEPSLSAVSNGQPRFVSTPRSTEVSLMTAAS